MKHGLKKFFIEYLSFSKSAQRAIWILICLIIIIAFAPVCYNKFFHKSIINIEHLNFPDSLFANNDSIILSKPLAANYNIPLLPFDPNLTTKNAWIEMGLNEKSAMAIEKYITKGGKFKKPDDLLRIYKFDTILYSKISELLIFPKHSIIKDSLVVTYKSAKISNTKVELNTADSLQLVSLPAIGPALTNRIMKYRKILGGFVNKNQLLEVYGITSQTFEKIENKVWANANQIIKLNLNTCNEEELRKHPYVGKYNARLIIKYRNFVKQISNFNELIINNIVNDTTLIKIQPYLKL